MMRGPVITSFEAKGLLLCAVAIIIGTMLGGCASDGTGRFLANAAILATAQDGKGMMSNKRSCGGTFTIHEPGKAPVTHANRC